MMFCKTHGESGPGYSEHGLIEHSGSIYTSLWI